MMMRSRNKGPATTTRGRQPINRSRSGDRLVRPRRPSSKRSRNGISCVAVFVVLLVLVILCVVATVHTTLQQEPGGIRKRQLFHQDTTKNGGEAPPHVYSGNSDRDEEETTGEEEPIYDGQRYEYSAKVDDLLKDPSADDTVVVEDDGDSQEEKEKPVVDKEVVDEVIQIFQEETADETKIAEAAARREKEEAERRQKEADQRREREDTERRAREENERREKEETERQQREEAERREREEIERRQVEEVARKDREAAAQREREEAEQRTREEAEQRERDEAARREREETERREREEAETRLREEAERREEEERRQREEAERQEALRRQRPKAQQAHHHHAETQQQADNGPKLPGQPAQPTISFCDFMRKKPDSSGADLTRGLGYSNPAVIVLGMEDTSTSLVWHVISQIINPGHRKNRRTHELNSNAATVDYFMLEKVGSDYQTEFWSKVSDKSHGKWLVHVFCQQQEHELATGFSWLTTTDSITKNQKALDTLDLIKALPRGSIKILRIKRNNLDAVIRHAQRGQHIHPGSPITLNRKTIFHDLKEVEKEQEAVDKFLRDHSIPHLTLDFETLFPYDTWPNLVQDTQGFQSEPNFINVDWRQLSSGLETTWRDVLRYLDVFRPVTMFDILQDAMQTHQVNTFWIQKEAVDKFGYIQQTLQGTHYQKLLRKPHPPSFHDRNKNGNHQLWWGEGDEM